MASIAYHASHEQFPPADLLAYAVQAQQCGFSGCHSSDHFHPWSKRQGQSGYVFAWLGAVMQATTFPVSVITAPGQRYHPAIVAQALATLETMFPHRLGVALGSGEALNENITGDAWLAKPIRNQRLLECVTIIRRLFTGETVSHSGLVNVREAKLYTVPQNLLPLSCAALTPATASWAGSWADGLLTIYKSNTHLQQMVTAFTDNGGAGKPVHVKLTFSYAREQQAAEQEAFHQWRSNCIDATKLADLCSVEAFDAAAEFVTLQDVLDSIPVSSDPQFFVQLINSIAATGVENIVLHNVGRNQSEFIADFGDQVLPFLDRHQ